MSWQVWVLISGVLTGLGQMMGKSQIHKISALQMGVLRDVTWVDRGALILDLHGRWLGRDYDVGRDDERRDDRSRGSALFHCSSHEL